jgi:hypothetical protein
VAWCPLESKSPPASHHSHAAAYDANRSELVVFGEARKVSGSDKAINETWVWDSSTSRWSQKKPTTVSSARLTPHGSRTLRGVPRGTRPIRACSRARPEIFVRPTGRLRILAFGRKCSEASMTMSESGSDSASLHTPSHRTVGRLPIKHELLSLGIKHNRASQDS